jgi:hypothetical protein
MNMLHKSCSVFYQESKKLGLHFSDFSMSFYRFYKIQPKVYVEGGSACAHGSAARGVAWPKQKPPRAGSGARAT